jgi:hypothetical protein
VGAQAATPAARLGQLPLRFEPNRGQFDARASFVARGAGYSLLFADGGVTLSLLRPVAAHAEPKDPRCAPQAPSPSASPSAPSAARSSERAAIQLRVVDGRPSRPLASGPLDGTTNYFLGRDASRWITGVHGFARVRYESVRPGVDLVFYGNDQNALEYDLVVEPGADASGIALAFDGAESVDFAPDGSLVLRVAGGEIRQAPPRAFQRLLDGSTTPVAVRYRAGEGGTIAFAVAPHDPAQALVIDPTLAYSTYLGGHFVDEAVGVAVDGAGSATVVGYTQSADFPVTPSAYQTTFQGNSNLSPPFGASVFVTKLAASGSSLVYSTYLGGVAAGGGSSNWSIGTSVAVDSSGAAYITGTTDSLDFPTVSPFQPTNHGAGDAFVAKLSPSGQALVYSTYLGGSDGENGNGIAIDAAGDAFVTGSTSSIDFPTASAFQAARANQGSPNNDAFITKLAPSGQALVYSTYLGGSVTDQAYGIAVDGAGDAYVTGITDSSDFPTALPFQASLGATGVYNSFVTKLAASGSSLVYSTYLGGNKGDSAYGIAVDVLGSAYVAGVAVSTNFPTVSPLQSSLRGPDDAFVTKFAASGQSLVYSTYLGGSGADSAVGIALDPAGDAYLTGLTASTDFPTLSPFESALGTSNGNAFVARLNPSGQTLGYATYLGGSQGPSPVDIAGGIAVDIARNAYVVGYTTSTNFPTVSAFQSSLSGAEPTGAYSDAFAAKVSTPVFASLGCFGDNAGRRDLTGSFETSTTNTPTQCIQYCDGKGYPYAAVEFGNQCFCGSSYGSYGPSANCTSPCSGDGTQVCGGGDAESVYQTAFFGCFGDNAGRRDLSGASSVGATNTPAQCLSFCKGAGYAYAAVEFGTQCFCGNTYGSYGPSAGCTSACAGDATQVCGGFDAESVFATAGTLSTTPTPALGPWGLAALASILGAVGLGRAGRASARGRESRSRAH